MGQRELYHSVKVLPALAPAVRNATTNGSNVDTLFFESCLFVVDVGTRTDGTHALKLQEAPDNGSGAPGAWTDVAAADMIGAFTADVASNTPQNVAYIGRLRWVRIVATVTPGATGAAYGALAILSHARHEPTQ